MNSRARAIVLAFLALFVVEFLFRTTSTLTAFEDSLPATTPSNHGNTHVPVVYVYNSNTIPTNHYSWAVIRLTLVHNPYVVLLTQPTVVIPTDLLLNVELVDITQLESDDLDTFRALYNQTPVWSLSEPWERFNLERSFFIRNWMRLTNASLVAYADSDVAFLTNMGQLANTNADAVLFLHPGSNHWNSFLWAVWMGSSVLHVDVLEDFCRFVVTAYQQELVLQLLSQKFQESPFVCDMTLWYLYVLSADTEFARFNGVPTNVTLPITKPRSFMDGESKWQLDNMHGHCKRGFSFHKNTCTAKIGTQPLNSLHFQGDRKNDSFRFVRKCHLTDQHSWWWG